MVKMNQNSPLENQPKLFHGRWTETVLEQSLPSSKVNCSLPEKR